MELGFNVEVPITSIRTFHYTIEADNFDEAYNKLKEIIKNKDANDEFDSIDDSDIIEYDWNNAIIDKDEQLFNDSRNT